MAEREEPRTLVQWGGLARVVLVAALVAIALLAVAAVVLVLAGGRSLGEVAAPLAGIAVVGFLATVVLAVGWSALRGMLRAGDVGERLASKDVGLLPPQARRRPRSKGDER